MIDLTKNELNVLILLVKYRLTLHESDVSIIQKYADILEKLKILKDNV